MEDVKFIAHRGIHSESIAENSGEALAACVGSNVDGVEVDVRITADGVCVVHHDTRLQSGARLSRLTYDELKTHDNEVLSVVEALEILRPFDGMINLEVKHILGERDRFRGLACVAQLSLDVLDAFHDKRNRQRVLVSSFSLPNVKRFTHQLPDISRAYLAPRTLSFSRMLFRAARYECSAIHVATAQMKAKKFSDFTRKAHDQGLAVRVFTVNTELDFYIARANGADAIFTDNIALMSF